MDFYDTEKTAADARLSGHGRQPVIALIGPTAVGKTALSLEIAEKLNAEVISVDSRQVYRYMDTGTDKISHEIRRKIPHHMIDIADPDEPFSVSDFAERACSAVRRITARGRVPLFAGGTPFYYNALFSASMNSSLPRDADIRRKWEDFARRNGADRLHAKLAEADPLSAERLHPNDIMRVSRALEIWELTGTPPSRLYAEGEKRDFGLDVLYIGLNRPRPQLFEMIEKRAASQFKNGFPEEVVMLARHGFDERCHSMRGFGYRELLQWHRGEITLEAALEGDISRTKAFCRRQMTWFGKFEGVIWLDASVMPAEALCRSAVEAAERHLEGSGLCGAAS